MSTFEKQTTANKSSQPTLASLPHGPFPCNQPKPRAAILCATVIRSFPSFGKVCLCPFLRSRPPLFCLISPEAGLLTGSFSIQVVLNESRIKAGKGPSEKRAKVFCLQRGSFFLT
jgi:hypothetical protein